MQAPAKLGGVLEPDILQREADHDVIAPDRVLVPFDPFGPF